MKALVGKSYPARIPFGNPNGLDIRDIYNKLDYIWTRGGIKTNEYVILCVALAKAFPYAKDYIDCLESINFEEE